MHTMRRIMGAVLVAGALVGCGDDGDDADRTDARSAEELRADAEAAIDWFETKATAAGFTGTDGEDGEDELTFSSSECKDLDRLLSSSSEDLPGELASVDSKTFDRSSDESMESIEASVGFVEDEEPLADLVDLFGDDRVGPCLEELMQTLVTDGEPSDPAFELREVHTTERALPLGDQAVGWEVGATIGAAGIDLSLPLVVRFDVVRVGTGAVFVLQSGAATALPFDPAETVDGLLEHAGLGSGPRSATES